MPRPQTLIRQWHVADDVATAAAPICADDGDVSWWAGVQRCFVGVATAGFAAALGANVAIAGAFNRNDDRPTPAALTVTEDAQQLPQTAQQPLNYVVWAEADEWVPPVAAALDDSTWQAPRQAVPQPFVYAWTDGDVPALTQAALDEGSWWPFTAVAAPPAKPATTADDQIVTTIAEEEGWQPAFARAPGPTLPPPWSADDWTPQLAFAPELDEGWQPPTFVAARPVVAVWWEVDERCTPAIPLQVDDEPWLPPAPLLVRANSVTWDADERVIPPSPLPIDDETWPLAPCAQRAALPLPAWSADDDYAPTTMLVAAEDAEWAPPQLRIRATLPTMPWAWADDHSAALAPATPAVPDEAYWWQPVFAIAFVPRAPCITDEVAGDLQVPVQVFTADSRSRLGAARGGAGQRLGQSIGGAGQRLGSGKT